jgi:hypothetical protein
MARGLLQFAEEWTDSNVDIALSDHTWSERSLKLAWGFMDTVKDLIKTNLGEMAKQIY